MPLVGFGTFMLNGEICTNSVVSAIQNGYRMIDTAEAYGNEKEVGEDYFHVPVVPMILGHMDL